MINSKRFLNIYAPLVRARTASVFCGAGISVKADMGNWRKLVKPLADMLGLDVKRENPLDIVQYFVNETSLNDTYVLNRLVEVFGRPADPTDYHVLLAEMPFERYWTTNYDALLETAIGNPQVVTGDETLSNADPNKKWVIKLNGSIDDRRNRNLVYSRQHFEEFEATNPTLHRYLLSSLEMSSFVFLGFSMTDPTLARALERIRKDSSNHTPERPHFVVVARSRTAYDRRKQEYWAKELARFYVETVIVETYDEVLDLVRRLASRTATRTACVIGSLPQQDRSIRILCESLGRGLVKQGFSLVTGCGHNVGTHCALAALNTIEEDPKSYAGVRVCTYFQRGGGSSLLKFGETTFVGSDYSEMRREMLQRADIAIVVAGEQGTREEIAIADELGVPVVPITSTGGAAAVDWRSVGGSPRRVVEAITDTVQRDRVVHFMDGLSVHEPPSQRVPKLLRTLQIILEWKAVRGDT